MTTQELQTVEGLLRLMKQYGATELKCGAIQVVMPLPQDPQQIVDETPEQPAQSAEDLVGGMVQDILKKRNPLDAIADLMQ